METRLIEFSGIEWFVKRGTCGPGPNNWSDSKESVWVDTNGKLHLKIRKDKERWYCAEVFATKSFGYGEYLFFIESDASSYQPNIVAGLFTYENDESEIDIEFSRWGDSKKNVGWYTIQPGPYNKVNQDSFPLNLSGTYSTHKFKWRPEKITFESYHGHYKKAPSRNFLINSWIYSGNCIPLMGEERLHINLWMLKGEVLRNQQEAEFVVSFVKVPNI
jgi:hypothetical protein